MQQELNFEQLIDIDEEGVNAFLNYLQLHNQTSTIWLHAKDIHLNFCPRTLRALANASGGRVISSCLGYKLTKLSTSEEINHCVNRLLSQAKEMSDRAMEIKKAAHQML